MADSTLSICLRLTSEPLVSLVVVLCPLPQDWFFQMRLEGGLCTAPSASPLHTYSAYSTYGQRLTTDTAHKHDTCTCTCIHGKISVRFYYREPQNEKLTHKNLDIRIVAYYDDVLSSNT